MTAKQRALAAISVGFAPGTLPRERGLPFTAGNVRSLMAGRKTMTRRQANPPPGWTITSATPAGLPIAGRPGRGATVLQSPFGQPGDRLWIREAYAVAQQYNKAAPRDLKPFGMTVLYLAGGSSAWSDDLCWRYEPDFPSVRPDWQGRARPPMFMCRWMTRALLDVVAVRVERLQEISEADAMAEGITEDEIDHVLHIAEAMNQREPRPAAWAFRTLWEDINGAGSWDRNPWVWVVEFRLSEARP